MRTGFRIEELLVAAFAHVERESVNEKDFFYFWGVEGGKLGHRSYAANRMDPVTGTSVVLK